MAIVNPRSPGNDIPSDWRYAQTEFATLKTLANKLGMHTAGWTLEYPPRSKRWFDPRWKMTYKTLEGQIITVYLGSSGREAAKTIKDTIPPYRNAVEARRKRADAVRVYEAKNQKKDLRRDPNVVRAMIQKWDRVVEQFHRKMLRGELPHSTSFATYAKQTDPQAFAFMRMRAGFLEISMKNYLYRHPHGHIFLTPPQSPEELKQRQKDLAETVYEKERQLRQEQQDNPNIGWESPPFLGTIG